MTPPLIAQKNEVNSFCWLLPSRERIYFVIKAIIFDCFGVLVTGSLENYLDIYLSGDVEKRRQAHSYNAQANAGIISYEELIQKYAELADADYEDVAKIIYDNPKNTRLLQYIKEELKSEYKIGVLSNAAGDILNELFDEDEVAMFDAAVLSYDVGLVKPDRQVYELIAEKLDVLPSECIFTDDNKSFCDGAETVGMQAVHYQNFEQFRGELELLLNNTDSNK